VPVTGTRPIPVDDDKPSIMAMLFDLSRKAVAPDAGLH
jgi:hypothetical protein